MLKGYLTNRLSRGETFLAFSRRHDIGTLREMFDSGAAE
jgi:hypothetical protein